MNSSEQPTGPRYWRSLDEYAERPEFQEWLHREFPAGASEIEGVNRRHFLKIMGASFALAGMGMAGCRRPEAKILPYSKQPERIVPGNPVYYASSFPGLRDSIPLMVETHQARPTKVEGNEKLAALTGGATDVFAQASVLDLYDPDRATVSRTGSKRLSQAELQTLLSELRGAETATGGQALAILAQPSLSPTRERLRQELRGALPNHLWAEYAPLAPTTAERALAQHAGQPVRPRPHLEKAKRILALDSDFLHRGPGHLAHARRFAKNRKAEAPEDVAAMARLYVAESHFTLSGAQADHRLRLSASQMATFARLVVAELLAAGGQGDLAGSFRRHGDVQGIDPAWAQACVADLRAHRGEALVLAGEHLPEEVHQLVCYANELLGAQGETVTYQAVPVEPATGIAELAEAIATGKVDKLVILGGNPVYDAPADLNFGDLVGQLRQVVHLGYHRNETARAVLEAGGSFLHGVHFLEAWGDGRLYDGTRVPVQPMIAPLFDGLQEEELLARLAGLEETRPYALMRQTFLAETGKSEAGFNQFLADGYLPESALPVVSVSIPAAALGNLTLGASVRAPSFENLEVRLVLDESVLDGRYANNGWLQECPDPMTKFTWDNALLVSPKLAEDLGYDTASGKFLIGGIAKKSSQYKRGREIAPLMMLRLGEGGLPQAVPLHILPGLPDYTVIAPLGYGRTTAGRVGDNVGFSAYPLHHSSAASGIRLGGKIALADGNYRLGNTQEHWSMEGRAIVREANADTFAEDPEFAAHMGMESHAPANYGKDQDKPLEYLVTEQPRGNSLYPTPRFTDPPKNVSVWNTEEGKEAFVAPQQWGMTVDLNSCLGCTACIIACQAENNIPIVGKDQVLRGREMHWIRLDRYFYSGDPKENRTSLPSDPQAALMPMACVHCEMAPCEQVCPVNATVHDSEGLNVMAYNRCIGTRYCANNCPYKVRRFNFFDWNKRVVGHFYEGMLGPEQGEGRATETLPQMQRNPDVTVRSRGVMEKCTYCVQRIQQAKIAQKVKAQDSNDVKVPDGVIKVACQQVCPTGAITFGDLSDTGSEVYRVKHSPRDYAVLGYLNVRPRTTYLARVRNPNPKMPDTPKMALSRMEYKAKSGASHASGHDSGESFSNGHDANAEPHETSSH